MKPTLRKPSQKQVIILLVVALLIFVLYNIVASLSRSGQIKVTLEVVPGDAIVTVNGEESSKTVYLNPGDYDFLVTKAGFKAQKETVTVGKDPVELIFILDPESQEAQEWLSSSSGVFKAEREALGGRAAERRGKELRSKNPIISLLPYENNFGTFSIDYGMSKIRTNGVFIEINASSFGGRKDALKWIRDQGYDPTDLEIIYPDFKNPITNEGLSND